MLCDMHCHLAGAQDALEVAQRYAERGEGLFSCGVDPHRYEEERALLAEAATTRVGLGLHPWWISRLGDAGLESFLEQVKDAPFVGEIGLDHGARHGADFEEQLCAFRAICERLSAHPGKVVTLHAVKSADEVLDCLEALGALDANACILHWFSGTSQQLTRALRAGCFVSLGAVSLRTKRGRGYARQIPAGRLLLETDLPPLDCGSIGYARMHAPLQEAAELLEGECGEEALRAACEASRRLLAL